VLLNYQMEKLNQIKTFRTTESNLEYLKQLKESDDRSVSYVINKMIEHFKKKNISDLREIE
jgi:hypothetical protein